MRLYDRLHPDSTERIPIHKLTALIGEYYRGFVSAAQAGAMLGIIEDQESLDDLAALKALIDAAPNKVAWMREFKDVVYLLELRVLYMDMASFNQRVSSIG